MEAVIIISILLFLFGRFCDSIMDTITHHWDDSIFSKLKEHSFWWNWFHECGWVNKYVNDDPDEGRIKWSVLGIKFNKPVQLCDAWHFFKMLKLFAYVAAIVIWFPSYGYGDWIYFVYWFVVGFGGNRIFLLFYNGIWLKKR